MENGEAWKGKQQVHQVHKRTWGHFSFWVFWSTTILKEKEEEEEEKKKRSMRWCLCKSVRGRRTGRVCLSSFASTQHHLEHILKSTFEMIVAECMMWTEKPREFLSCKQVRERELQLDEKSCRHIRKKPWDSVGGQTSIGRLVGRVRSLLITQCNSETTRRKKCVTIMIMIKIV